MPQEQGHQSSSHEPKHYRHLALMAVLSFIAMYALMYAMVDRFANVYNNLNQVYMAGVMASPMVLIELVVMRAMYRDRRLNLIVAAVAVAVGVLFFVAIRKQTGIGDRQFLRSMIPHHAGAILMCREAELRGSEIVELCNRPETGIVATQQREIAQMRALLDGASR